MILHKIINIEYEYLEFSSNIKQKKSSLNFRKPSNLICFSYIENIIYYITTAYL